MKKLLLFALTCITSFATDLAVQVRGQFIDVGRNLTWGSSGVGGVNNVFLFTPTQPDYGLCVYVVNNNPTSSHNFTLQIWQTADRRASTFTDNSTRYIPTQVQGLVSPFIPPGNWGSVTASGMTTAYAHTNGAARVAVAFGGTATAGGSPDTTDIFAVQVADQSCGAVNTSAQNVKIVPYALCTGLLTFDTFMSNVPATLTSVTSGQTCITTIYCVNLLVNPATVTIVNGAGTQYYLGNASAGFSIPGASSIALTLGGMSSIGIQWSASSASAIQCQILGIQ